MRPRDHDTFLLCEDTGELACNGKCPIHSGGACLIITGWVGKDWTKEFPDGAALTGEQHGG